MILELAIIYGIIFVVFLVYGIYSKKGLSILFASLMLLFLTLQLRITGLELVNGINPVTGAYTFSVLNSGNDPFIGLISLSGLGIGIAMLLFSLYVFIDSVILNPNKGFSK